MTLEQEGAMHCKSPEDLLFNDLDEISTKMWLKTLQPQPAEGWDKTVTYCGWRKVTSGYLVCDNDQIIPAPMQHELAALAGSIVETYDAGHMPMLSMPDKVAEVIVNAAVRAAE